MEDFSKALEVKNNKKDRKIEFTNWQIALVQSCHYDIYKSSEDDNYGVQVTLFFDDELGNTEEENSKVLTIPFCRGFESAQEALEWIEKCGEIFPNTLNEVWVLNENGDIITKWDLISEDEDEEEDDDEEVLEEYITNFKKEKDDDD